MEKKKVIKVIAGRECQVKVRKNFSQEDYAYNLIKRAEKICEAIQASMEKKVNENSFQSTDDDINEKMISNNVVMFTSVRGTGKTSIMRSFAEYLKSKLNTEENSLYYVLPDIIEPALLSEKESLVRFVLSRLYTDFIGKIEYGVDRFQNDENKITRNDIADIKAQFRKCLRNIEKITNPKSDELEMEELDALADIGFSADLRRNIEELIDKYLKIQKKNEKAYQYVVIQIDDADLAMGTTYQICEDIRNYLNVKKLIILMAADYKQMEYAVYQEYVKKYEKLISLNPVNSDKKFYYDHCHEMAAKYLEKAFPEGYRVNLPAMSEDMLGINEEKTIIQYIEIDKTGKEKQIIDNPEKYKSAQSLLMHYIYKKTGMVFDDTIESVHPIIPKTFRELTHFLKLLHEMSDIAPEEAYRNIPGKTDSVGKKEREVISKNISKFERYFGDYWCPNNLSDAEERLMQTIVSFGERNNVTDINDSITDFFNEKDKNNKDVIRDSYQEGEISIRSCIKRIEVYCNKSKKHLKLLEAIKIYFTIHLNKWVAEAWDNENELAKITCYIGQAFPYENAARDWVSSIDNVHDVLEYKTDKDIGSLINTDEILADTENAGLIDCFLIDEVGSKLYANRNLDRDMLDSIVKEMVKDTKTDKHIRVLDALMFIFRHPNAIRMIQGEDLQGIGEKAEISDKDVLNLPGIKDYEMQLPESIQTIREIVTSYDLQEHILKAYDEKVVYYENFADYQTSASSKGWLSYKYEAILKELDAENNLVLSNSNRKERKGYFFDAFFRKSNFYSYALIWLTNLLNRQYCIEKEKKYLTESVSNRISMLEKKDFIKSEYNREDDAPYFIHFAENEIKKMESKLKGMYTKINNFHNKLEELDKKYDELLDLVHEYNEASDYRMESTTQKEMQVYINGILTDYKSLLKEIKKQIHIPTK